MTLHAECQTEARLDDSVAIVGLCDTDEAIDTDGRDHDCVRYLVLGCSLRMNVRSEPRTVVSASASE